ncbi:hypothetical protein P280DRAFT_447789 [Massarina eburnea CBS 473.64]|uniref:Nuclear envelope protein n=1 Tax=Massarina eburnea CBS 473.64 TaxID=1395130 RepID=A0A6A6S571_9PLEO|nr:hypothetical protein P280DRAFT_447789 [Massarina eburnea CBS 473.64]
MAPVHPARPYRDFLTPALHKRFTDGSWLTLMICCIISAWMDLSTDTCKWAVLSIAPVALVLTRMLLIFISAFIISMLRVAQWRVGHRNTLTPWDTFFKYVFRKNTLITIAGYGLSAFIYGEIYIWTRAEKDRLTFTDRGGREHDWIRLNERPLYLRYMFGALAIVQAAVHLWFDYDKIEVPAMKPRNDMDAQDPTPQVEPWVAIKQSVKSMARTAVPIVILTSFGATTLYFMLFRSFFWSNYYSLARRVVSLRRTSSPFGLPPFAPLFMKFFTEGFLLVSLWQFVNNAFSIYISQAPLKIDPIHKTLKPITSDSKDPNGSLLSGLKMKTDTVKAIALWELALITDRFPERRKTIYGELERKPVATFKQVTDICLAEIRLLISRLNIALDPKYQSEDAQVQKPTPGPISLVPQIGQPLTDAPIQGLGAKREKRDELSAFTSSIAKNFSSPENSKQAYARRGIQLGEEGITAGAAAVNTKVAGWWPTVVSTYIGYPFRHSLRRTTSLIVTGAPYSRISLLCNSITALTNLTMSSLREDDCGRFSNQVPEMIRVFTTALKKLEEYMASLTVHWSDVETLAKPEEERMKVPEVELVRECLKDGLEKILRNFGEFLLSMGLSRGEIAEAKRLAARGPEMATVR